MEASLASVSVAGAVGPARDQRARGIFDHGRLERGIGIEQRRELAWVGADGGRATSAAVAGHASRRVAADRGRRAAADPIRARRAAMGVASTWSGVATAEGQTKEQ